MIVYLEGKVIKKTPTHIVVKTYGVGYGVNVSLMCSNSINENDDVQLHITHILREDASKLYGFIDENEKILFEELIKVNGVGPASAMALLSSMDIKTLNDAIISEKASVLCKAPGIGAKTANRLILELKDKIVKIGLSAQANHYYEAQLALISLGFKAESVSKALKDLEANNVSDLVKQALKKLS